MLNMTSKKALKIGLVTGATGSIGSELVRKLSKDLLVYALDVNESALHEWRDVPNINPVICNIKDFPKVRSVISKIKPDIIYHAAAYKHVELMEMFPDEAMETNVVGLFNVIMAAQEAKVGKMVFISTDKAVNPTSVMGKTKRLGELLCQRLNGMEGLNLITVRFGNVLMSRGSVIPIWKRQVENNEDITVTDETTERYFMTIFEACDLVIKAGEMGQGGEIYILDMGNPKNIYSMARQYIDFSGKDLQIKIIGMRQGEKIKEKLYNLDEVLKKTKYAKIYQIEKK
jgi:FlaA1/EpsC-like NDP-sugar epimerase